MNPRKAFTIHGLGLATATDLAAGWFNGRRFGPGILNPVRLLGRVVLILFGLSALVTTGVVRADSGDPWSTWRLRTNTASMWWRFATGGGMIVAGDDRGAIYASPNGATWSRRETGTNILVRGLAYGNDRFVAMFGLAGFSTSPDGLTWSAPVPFPDPYYDLFALNFAQGAFTAVGYHMTSHNPVILRSTDGIEWNVSFPGTNLAFRALTYDRGIHMAVGHAAQLAGGEVFTSSNGTDWTRQPPTPMAMYGVAGGNGVFVALSGNGVARSTNGVQWVQSSVLPGFSLASISFLEGNFVITGNPGLIATSSDGIIWTRHPSGIEGSYTYWTAGSIGGRVVVAGDSHVAQSGPFEGAVPIIVQPPASRLQRVGTTYTNSVVVEHHEPVTFQWLHDGLPLSGATNATIEIANTTELSSGIYSAVITGTGISVTSSAPAIIAAPVGISLQPVSQEVLQGGTATFSVSVTGTPPIAYRWRRGGSTTEFSVLNSRTSFFTITNAQLSGVYSVVVSNVVKAPGELSASATLTVVADSDHDGLPDAYETQRGFNPMDPADGSLDSDGDGISNASEYLAGTDPQQAQSFLKVDRVTVDTGARVEFSTAAGKTYTVQFTDDLSAGLWSRLTDVPAKTAASTETATDPSASAARFYRLVTPRQP